MDALTPPTTATPTATAATTAATRTPTTSTPSPPTTPATQDLIARLWARFRPLAVERVDLVAACVLEPAAGPVTSVAALDRTATCAHGRARQAAHDLAGALGSYGRPEGSALAARIEALLDGRGDAAEGPALVDALRREVER